MEATQARRECAHRESGLRDVLMLVSDVDFLKGSLRECERRVQPEEEARDDKDLTFYLGFLLIKYFHVHISFNSSKSMSSGIQFPSFIKQMMRY